MEFWGVWVPSVGGTILKTEPRLRSDLGPGEPSTEDPVACAPSEGGTKQEGKRLGGQRLEIRALRSLRETTLHPSVRRAIDPGSGACGLGR
ncbi:hypothetical protein NDU88_006878 [Pleurodeles waltl]|uniref:Uncharacterized protein n=1 Tax=Pleurodeles waltl TaxID=8319 RepID=A0AAV7PN64_PLEWA|nr:hypothetical protein NDU88_006878 [Pleurodeles waltl]